MALQLQPSWGALRLPGLPRRELPGMRLMDAIAYLAGAYGSITRLDFVVDLMLPVALVRAPGAPSQHLTGRSRG